MKTIQEKIRDIKANMKRMNDLLKNYQAMEAAQLKATNVTVYTAAGEQMKYDYKMLIEETNKMLNGIDILGTSCGALDIRDYNRVEKHTFMA